MNAGKLYFVLAVGILFQPLFVKLFNPIDELVARAFLVFMNDYIGNSCKNIHQNNISTDVDSSNLVFIPVFTKPLPQTVDYPWEEFTLPQIKMCGAETICIG